GRWGGAAVAQILLIDDDGFYRGLIRQILEEGGHQVIEATDGPEGVERFRAQRPDLVLTDMRMPGVDGAEVIRSLRQLDRRRGSSPYRVRPPSTTSTTSSSRRRWAPTRSCASSTRSSACWSR